MHKLKNNRSATIGLTLLISLTAGVILHAGKARGAETFNPAALLSGAGNEISLAGYSTIPPAPADGYVQHNLVSDLPGLADRVDLNLANPWGVTFAPTGPFWVANNGTGTSTLYRGDGTPAPNPASPLVVKIPPAEGKGNGKPTGIVFNGTPGFVVSEAGRSGPALFIFASEDGTISGWNPGVNPTNAIRATVVPGAVYKGLAIGRNRFGVFLFATNFHDGTVDVFDSTFHRVFPPSGGLRPVLSLQPFHDLRIRPGFAPFGIQNIGGVLVVTYAKQEKPENEDDEPGPGNGFVDFFDTSGHLLRHFAEFGSLNSPWGVALAPPGFGKFSLHLLIGNFGDGRINAFDLRSGALDGQLADPTGKPITIEGLWALAFGNGAAAGGVNELFFTAGIEDEDHGLFGVIRAAGP